MQPRTLIAPLACLALAGGAFADPVTGRVVDGEGRPVAGVVVAHYWHYQPDAIEPHYSDVTGDDGTFEIDINFYNRPAAFMALNADRTQGGVIVVQPGSPADVHHIITLGPLVEFKGDFSCDGKPEWTNVYMSLRTEGEGVQPARIAGFDSEDAEFRFKLPPGDYQFWAYGRDVQYHIEDISLTADEPVVDKGTVNLEPTVLARHYGKEPPPLNITEARGIDADVTLADLKGKWVLLEYWGFW